MPTKPVFLWALRIAIKEARKDNQVQYITQSLRRGNNFSRMRLVFINSVKALNPKEDFLHVSLQIANPAIRIFRTGAPF